MNEWIRNPGLFTQAGLRFNMLQDSRSRNIWASLLAAVLLSLFTFGQGYAAVPSAADKQRFQSQLNSLADQYVNCVMSAAKAGARSNIGQGITRYVLRQCEPKYNALRQHLTASYGGDTARADKQARRIRGAALAVMAQAIITEMLDQRLTAAAAQSGRVSADAPPSAAEAAVEEPASSSGSDVQWTIDARGLPVRVR